MEKKQLFFNKLVKIIYDCIGLDCKEYNEEYIKRRVNSRILAHNLTRDDYFSYIKLLEGNLDEIRDLFNALTINVTKFFRDPELWSFLRTDIFPRIIAEKKEIKSNIIYIWSCGCSSGEEPYSIAMLLKELTEGTKIYPNIVATDIDELSIQKAREGKYSHYALSDLPSEYIVRYFHRKEPACEILEIDKSIKQMVRFSRHNFFGEQPPGNNFDMIFCRNVVIYFTPEAKERLFSIFHKSLVPHGWFVTGKTEILFSKHLKSRFYPYNEPEKIYRKERRINQSHAKIEKRQNWWPGYKKH